MASIFILDRELSLGERVRITRMVKGWRQIDVAAVVRCSPCDVSQLERGIPISSGVRARILEALGVDDE
jgi:transcriptional regulator with XRE-family HTH domain